MSTSAIQPFTGSFRAQAEASTFAFAVGHSGVFRFRGELTDVAATLRDDGDGLVLEGAARVESISIVEPAAMRASLLGAKFFDAEHHPEVQFRSTAIRLGGDGRAEVDGELTMRGVTRPVTAHGEYAAPREAGYAEVGGMRLQATIDRREWGFDWQNQLPGGADALAWDVELDIDLLFMREDTGDVADDVLLVSGSLREGSFNTALLREAATALPDGVGHRWLEGVAALPPYSEDHEGARAPASAAAVRLSIATAGAVLVATPEYNGAIPGGLKNVVDWASRPFPDNAWRDKPVAVIGASTGLFGAAWAQAQLRTALDLAGARVVDAELAVGSAHEAFLPSGALRDPALADALRATVTALIQEESDADESGSDQHRRLQALS